LAVEGGDLAVAWAEALPGRFGGAEALLALDEPLQVLVAAAVWSDCRCQQWLWLLRSAVDVEQEVAGQISG
jgi:hypothetical protein